MPDEEPPSAHGVIVPAGVTVSFATMGIKYMLEIAQDAQSAPVRRPEFPNCVEVHRCCKEKGFVQHVVLKRALLEADVTSKRDFVWVFDTRMFHDPAESWELCKHVGTNGDIVDGIVQHRRFPCFLDSLYFAWQHIGKCINRGAQIRIILFCKSGRHRSVAAALVAAHLFECTEGMPVPRSTRHVCAYWWSQLCPKDCPKCERQSGIRDKALHQAREMWKEVLARKIK